MVALSDFLTRYPNFITLPDHIINDALLDAEIYCPQSWGEVKRLRGIFLRAAHTLTMDWLQTAEIAAASSSIASGSTGRSPTAADDDLNLTTYGRQFKQLRNSIPAIGLTL